MPLNVKNRHRYKFVSRLLQLEHERYIRRNERKTVE